MKGKKIFAFPDFYVCLAIELGDGKVRYYVNFYISEVDELNTW